MSKSLFYQNSFTSLLILVMDETMNNKGNMKGTALHYAIFNGSEKIVNFLLKDCGAYINQTGFLSF